MILLGRMGGGSSSSSIQNRSIAPVFYLGCMLWIVQLSMATAIHIAGSSSLAKVDPAKTHDLSHISSQKISIAGDSAGKLQEAERRLQGFPDAQTTVLAIPVSSSPMAPTASSSSPAAPATPPPTDAVGSPTSAPLAAATSAPAASSVP
eukprot:c23341_g1_i1 orf=193-639(+)